MPATLQTRPEPAETAPPRRRRPLAQMADPSAKRSVAARVLAENPDERLAVAGFNSSI
jgi:FXSXX-COOH protein